MLDLIRHADADFDDGCNQPLLKRRADVVRCFLVEKFSLAPESLVPSGYGKMQLKNRVDPFGEKTAACKL